jgi:hypothetical protein
LVENSEVGISARQTRNKNIEELPVSQLGYLAIDTQLASTANQVTFSSF